MSMPGATDTTKPGARALEGRLLAPCCWIGTLDAHESELAQELRREIDTRLGRGETAQSVQDDFVARFGSRVIASQGDRPMATIVIAVALLMIAVAIALVAALRRWLRAELARNADFEVGSNSSASPVDAELDARLDRELANFD